MKFVCHATITENISQFQLPPTGGYRKVTHCLKHSNDYFHLKQTQLNINIRPLSPKVFPQLSRLIDFKQFFLTMITYSCVYTLSSTKPVTQHRKGIVVKYRLGLEYDAQPLTQRPISISDQHREK